MSGYFDMHCHLLYGVDDGPESMEASLDLLRQEYDDGVGTIYLTPHYRRGLFECPSDLVVRNFELLKERAEKILPDLKLRLGREIHVNMDVVQTIKSGSDFTLGNTDYVLLEFPEYSDKQYMIERCNDVRSSGFNPIIAHAERCAAIRKDIDLLQRLVDMGAYIQMNAGSIIGEEGLAWKWFCKKAMKRDLLHFVGSDAHDLKSRRPNIGRCAAYIERIMGADYRDRIMKINPQEITAGSVW